MILKKIITFYICLFNASVILCADNTYTADTLTIEIHYRQGSYQIDSTYMNNPTRLKKLLDFLHKLSSDSTLRLDHFRVVSGASPEGSSLFNKELSENRTKSIRRYLEGRISPVQSSVIKGTYVGTDWEKLRTMVEGSGMPYKEKVLDILRNTPEWVVKNGVVVDSRKRQLMNLRGGDCWRYMEAHFFSELRRSFVELEYSLMPKLYELEEVSNPIEVAEITDVAAIAPDTGISSQNNVVALPVQQELPSPFYMAIKTNLLYDAFLVPNIGIEFYLGKGWALGGNWMYAWWKNDKRYRYWRVYGGEIGLRKYLGGTPLIGHHVGIYGQMVTYDFEMGGRGYIGGRPGSSLWEKAHYGAGFEYGYSLAVARRLNLDFSLGLGYLGGTYYEYAPMDGHYVWETTKKRHWFGPTKAEVSLVWLLGRGNYNK